MRKICWIDMETTGLDKDVDQIIEFAALCQDEEFQVYCKPENKPKNFEIIENLTGIKWDFLEKNGLPENVFYKKILDFFMKKVDKYDKKDKMIFAGYNCNFDIGFLRKLFEKNGNNFFGSIFFSCQLDIMSIIADALYNEKIGLQENYKLGTVYKALLKKDFNAHSAIGDIEATKELYLHLKGL